MATISANNRYTPGLVYNPLSFEEVSRVPQAMYEKEKDVEKKIETVDDVLNTLNSNDPDIQQQIGSYKNELTGLASKLSKEGYTDEVYNKFKELKSRAGSDIKSIADYTNKQQQFNSLVQKAMIDPANVVMGNTKPTYKDFREKGDSVFNEMRVGNIKESYQQGQEAGKVLKDKLIEGGTKITAEEIKGLPYQLAVKVQQGMATPKDVEDYLSTSEGAKYLENQISSLGYNMDESGKLPNAFKSGIVATAFRAPEIKIMENQQAIMNADFEKKKALIDYENSLKPQPSAGLIQIGYNAFNLENANNIDDILSNNGVLQPVLKANYDKQVAALKQQGVLDKDIPSYEDVVNASNSDKDIFEKGLGKVDEVLDNIFGYVGFGGPKKESSMSSKDKLINGIRENLKKEIAGYNVNGMREAYQLNTIDAASNGKLDPVVQNAYDNISSSVLRNVGLLSSDNKEVNKLLATYRNNPEKFPELKFIPEEVVPSFSYKGVGLPLGLTGHFEYKNAENKFVPTKRVTLVDNTKTSNFEDAMISSLDKLGIKRLDGMSNEVLRTAKTKTLLVENIMNFAKDKPQLTLGDVLTEYQSKLNEAKATDEQKLHEINLLLNAIGIQSTKDASGKNTYYKVIGGKPKVVTASDNILKLITEL